MQAQAPGREPFLFGIARRWNDGTWNDAVFRRVRSRRSPCCHGASARARVSVASGRALDFAAAHHARATLAAGLLIAKRQRVIVDELSVEITVAVDQDDGLVVLAGQFADHRLLRVLA